MWITSSEKLKCEEVHEADKKSISTQGRRRPQGFLQQLDEFLFYNSWKENCGKLHKHSSDFDEWLIHFNNKHGCFLLPLQFSTGPSYLFKFPEIVRPPPSSYVRLLGEVRKFPVDHRIDRILFWYKKTVMSKKEVIATRNLKDCLPNLWIERGREITTALYATAFGCVTSWNGSRVFSR